MGKRCAGENCGSSVHLWEDLLTAHSHELSRVCRVLILSREQLYIDAGVLPETPAMLVWRSGMQMAMRKQAKSPCMVSYPAIIGKATYTAAHKRLQALRPGRQMQGEIERRLEVV